MRTPHRSISWLAALLTALTVVHRLHAVAPDTVASPPDERAIFRAFDQRDYPQAAALIESWLDARPNDPQMLYNLACAYSRLGRTGPAADTLYKAVEAGFRDFRHMRNDADLLAIRDEPVYQAIIDASRRLERERAQSGLARWKARFGSSAYRYEVDAERRLAYAAALNETSFAEMRAMLAEEADYLIKTLFDAPPAYDVLIAVPTPGDAEVLFNGNDAIGGLYEHHQHRIVTREIGGSLRHELVHAFHYGHMERLGLRRPHPLWIQEGMAALFEDYERGPDGGFRFLPNERNNVVKRLARIGRLTRWSELFKMSGDRFMRNPGRMYPQVRSIFRFLADGDQLASWYRAFVLHYDEDTTGRVAFERVFDQPIDVVESRWREWVRRQPMIDNRVGFGDASLGITSDANSSNDGVLIAEVLPGSAASKARLFPGDVIVAVDSQFTRSIHELLKIIGGKEVGERVEIRVRRRERYFTRSVALQALR
ncbi:MAG: PDZ domain-containing protein [Phycisphaerales bacterium]|nr:PDZ domain-containing protein [Phycisphaerae bacterium]NNF44410.1 PDZ domain-containing protein [Phycisphaerales bacterium]NNM25818.1 PDZ domain-containing protein [Phycisphaerales bacterium]